MTVESTSAVIVPGLCNSRRASHADPYSHEWVGRIFAVFATASISKPGEYGNGLKLELLVGKISSNCADTRMGSAVSKNVAEIMANEGDGAQKNGSRRCLLGRGQCTHGDKSGIAIPCVYIRGPSRKHHVVADRPAGCAPARASSSE